MHGGDRLPSRAERKNSLKNIPPIMKALCPELQQALLTFATHINGCEDCRHILADYGLAKATPILLQTQKIICDMAAVAELLRDKK